MGILERIWELIGLFFGSLLGSIERTVTAVFGSSNARQVKRLQQRVERINALEESFQALSDEQLRAKTDEFRHRLAAGETLDDILEEAFATCREAGRRFLGMRHYDVQLVGGMVLHEGKIAEMVTGEGKTLVATLPAYLNALEGRGVHVVTVNDYLARRDMEWMAPLYLGLGLTVGSIQSGMETLERQKSYSCDITYGTNNEFGFDYLRDNMKPAARGDQRFGRESQQCQGPLHYAIIDEVDNILIDEARTPLIISGPAHHDPGRYADANRIALQLQPEEHFTVNEKDRNVTLTDEGVRVAERLAGVESFYTAGNMDWPHMIDSALKAQHLYKRDVNYVVKDGQVIIVDEFTGRLMEGRQWSDGLHQAVEAKEGVKIKEETQTFATITLQNFFKLYKKISGMTGTAMTEANEFYKIYKLDVVAIPTNRKMQRIEHPDVIYLTEDDKFRAVAEEIERTHKWDVLVMKDGSELWGVVQREDEQNVEIVLKGGREREHVPRSKIVRIDRRGRPVLVGTVSIEKSERLSHLLDQRGIPHQVLNAKHHKREAEIVAQAGRQGAVTIATNMAGRGTDIILGGNAEAMAWARLQDKYPTRLDVPPEEWTALIKQIEEEEQTRPEGQRVRELGGLYVVGTERHESRRIDLQLRGRCGRQGDPGSSRFFLSLEDDLMRIFAGDFVKSVMVRMGMKEGEAIESGMVTRRIAGAQKKVEERHFEVRKNLLEYDEVMDEQRKRVYQYRQKILDGASCRQLILDQVDSQIDRYVDMFMAPGYGADSFASWAGNRLGCALEGRDYRNTDFTAAEQIAKDQAERFAESAIVEAIEENLPVSDDQEEWNWQAMAAWINARYGTTYRDRDLQRIGRENLEEELFGKARQKIAEIDLQEGATFLEAEFNLKTVVAWMRNKFGIELTPQELRDKEPAEIKRLLKSRAEAAYAQKETEYPVLTGLYRYTQRAANGNIRLDGEGLAHWAEQRFGRPVTPAGLNNGSWEALRQNLVELSQQSEGEQPNYQERGRELVRALYRGDVETDSPVASVADPVALDALHTWLTGTLGSHYTKAKLSELTVGQLQDAVDTAIEDRLHPEMRRMERAVLLNIVDSAWKDHLLAMDHLRNSVGLKGYAQLDPKVEYKREGMRLFERMWLAIGERTTDLVYRMESLNEDFVSSTWVAPQARHEAAPSVSTMRSASASSGTATATRSEHEAAAAQSQEGRGRVDPIRNRGERVGRNDPCPCGSGKKYKNCCLRKESEVI